MREGQDVHGHAYEALTDGDWSPSVLFPPDLGSGCAGTYIVSNKSPPRVHEMCYSQTSSKAKLKKKI